MLCNNVPSFAGQTANLWNLQSSVFKWTAKYSSMLSKKSKNMYTEKMIEQLFRLSYICYQFKPLQITVYLLPLSSTFTQSSTGKHWLSFLHFSPWVCKSSKHIYFHFMAAWAQCRVLNEPHARQLLSIKHTHLTSSGQNVSMHPGSRSTAIPDIRTSDLKALEGKFIQIIRNSFQEGF